MQQTYTQSVNLEQIKAKHPFPWMEQRFGGNIRMVDANGSEVILFELTALASIVTISIANSDKKTAKES